MPEAEIGGLRQATLRTGRVLGIPVKKGVPGMRQGPTETRGLRWAAPRTGGDFGKLRPGKAREVVSGCSSSRNATKLEGSRQRSSRQLPSRLRSSKAKPSSSPQADSKHIYDDMRHIYVTRSTRSRQRSSKTKPSSSPQADSKHAHVMCASMNTNVFDFSVKLALSETLRNYSSLCPVQLCL